jgi:type IV fimbrial biogenesis protein FimT
MNRGFTIIELMIVVVIVAVFASLAAPSMRDLVASAAIRGASSDFYATLVAARSEAIKRRASATIAPVGATWNTGWTVSLGGNTFQKVDPLSPRVSVQVAATTPITYGMNGRVTSGAQTIAFYNAANLVVQARCVSIDANGLPRMRTDSNHDPSDGCN